MLLLYIGALVAELAGLLLAARGFRRTWQDFRRPTDEFWRPVFAPLTTRIQAAHSHLRRVFGGPPPAKHVHAWATNGVGITDSATATMTWGPFPSVEKDPAAFMALLDQRMSELLDRQQATERALQAARRESAGLHKEATASISDVREEARGQVRTITVDGLRDQVIGWMLIVSGVIAAGLGDIINAW